jgi:hypothetical protein
MPENPLERFRAKWIPVRAKKTRQIKRPEPGFDSINAGTALATPAGREHLRLLSLVAVILLGATLAACSGGDFGRTRQDVRNDDMHRWMGAEATGSIGRQPSRFQLTDNERMLRDLAYPLVEPPHSRPAWKSVFGDYEPFAPPWRQKPAFDRSAYGRQLIDEPHRSDASRYAQLIDDVRDDITRFDPFFNTARQVFDLDSKRNASLRFVSDLSPRERADAVARMQENALIVQWVQQCLEQRIASYRWALEHLVVQAPDDMAADADRLIRQLAVLTANPPVAAAPVIGHAVRTRG